MSTVNDFLLNLNKKLKYSKRYSSESLAKGAEDSFGSWFLTPLGNMVNMAKYLIVGAFIDTIRQLYTGVLDEGFLDMLDRVTKNDELARINQQYPSAKLPLGEFIVSRMGKACGYRFKLQNNEIGLVVLVGSYYHKAEKKGPHLKIECSPHFIKIHSPEILQARLDSIARAILHEFEYQGIAIHLAADIQGWKPGADFLERFSTYAKFVRSYIGLQTAEVGQGFSDVVAKYGNQESETITIGKPIGLQTSIYNKTKQSKVVDKVDYYQNEWKNYSLGVYDENGPDVYRLEYRFHHSVIKDFEINGKSGFVNFLQIAPLLNYLWQYALVRNRLDLTTDVIDPVWQKFIEDVQFSTEPPYGLVKKVKKNNLSAIGKNIQLMLGNLISIQARKSADLEVFLKLLRRLEIYDDILEYYRIERKIGEKEFRDKCQRSLTERRLLRNAA